MSATVEHAEPADSTAAHGEQHHTHADLFYVKIALILAFMTALEVSTYYVDFGPAFLPLLLTLMAVKFFMVAWFFMHLRDDAKLFGRLFWAGFILAVAVYVVTLATFQFFRR